MEIVLETLVTYALNHFTPSGVLEMRTTSLKRRKVVRRRRRKEALRELSCHSTAPILFSSKIWLYNIHKAFIEVALPYDDKRFWFDLKK